jgi:hypothetical protein
VEADYSRRPFANLQGLTVSRSPRQGLSYPALPLRASRQTFHPARSVSRSQPRPFPESGLIDARHPLSNCLPAVSCLSSHRRSPSGLIIPQDHGLSAAQPLRVACAPGLSTGRKTCLTSRPDLSSLPSSQLEGLPLDHRSESANVPFGSLFRLPLGTKRFQVTCLQFAQPAVHAQRGRGCFALPGRLSFALHNRVTGCASTLRNLPASQTK